MTSPEHGPISSKPREAPPEERYDALARELTQFYLSQATSADHMCLKNVLERLERDVILLVLAQTNGNQSDAAELMGLKPTTLHYKLKRLKIQPVHRFETPPDCDPHWPR